MVLNNRTRSVNGPFNSPVLKMYISEHPFPGDSSQKGGVLPSRIARTTDTEQEIIDDVVGAIEASNIESIDPAGGVTADMSVEFRRGAGQFTDIVIMVDIEGATPSEVSQLTRLLSGRGYTFDRTEIK